MSKWKPIETAPSNCVILIRSAKGQYGYEYAVAYGQYGELAPDGVYATYEGCGSVAFSFKPLEWAEIED